MRTLAAVVAAAALLAGCSIRPDDEPRDIPAAQRRLDPTQGGAGPATGEARIFLLTGGSTQVDRRIRSVLRDVPLQSEPLLRALIAGPNEEETEAGLGTSVPPSITLRSARIVGSTLDVDISGDILELRGPSLRQAVAQIVFTASELDGVRRVRLRLDGQPREWPNGRGELQAEPLSVYDFPGVAESAQPPYPPFEIAI